MVHREKRDKNVRKIVICAMSTVRICGTSNSISVKMAKEKEREFSPHEIPSGDKEITETQSTPCCSANLLIENVRHSGSESTARMASSTM